MLVEVLEKGLEQFEEDGEGSFGFGTQFKQGYGVGGVLKAGEILAEGRVGLTQNDFAQGMQFGTPAPVPSEAEISDVKKVELSAKWRFGSARSFGDSGQAPELRSEPMDDEARFGQEPRAQDEATAALLAHDEAAVGRGGGGGGGLGRGPARFRSLAKGNSAASARTNRCSARFMRRRASDVRSSWP